MTLLRTRPNRTLTSLLITGLSAVVVAAASTAVTSPASGSPAPGRSAAAVVRAPSTDAWETSVIDKDQSFRGLDAVSKHVAWVSGSSLTKNGPGRVFRTTDGGRTWVDVSPPDTTGLEFRDVEARSADKALVLAIGSGEASRVYRTTDGGTTWTETFRNTNPDAFYNCLDFYPGGRIGLAVSDAVGGKFQIIRTTDSGRSWTELPTKAMPAADGEYNFSASGDCLTIRGKHAWFGSGGALARVFHSKDRGDTWEAAESGLIAGEAAGVISLAFKTPRRGVALGGDFAAPDTGSQPTAYLRGAQPWTLGGALTHVGEDAAWLLGQGRTVLAVGESGKTTGSSVSRDGGLTWSSVSTVGFHTLDCTADKWCFAAGGDGRVGRLANKALR